MLGSMLGPENKEVTQMPRSLPSSQLEGCGRRKANRQQVSTVCKGLWWRAAKLDLRIRESLLEQCGDRGLKEETCRKGKSRTRLSDLFSDPLEKEMATHSCLSFKEEKWKERMNLNCTFISINYAINIWHINICHIWQLIWQLIYGNPLQ